MSKPLVYLAGPVRNDVDGGAVWRDDVIEVYSDGVEFVNPLDKYNVPVEGLSVVGGDSEESNSDTVGVNEIVEGDKEMLEMCDAVLVGYSNVQSIGTPMEVMWAYERDYPVGIWIRDPQMNPEDLSPWYQYHADFISPQVYDVMVVLERELYRNK